MPSLKLKVSLPKNCCKTYLATPDKSLAKSFWDSVLSVPKGSQPLCALSQNMPLNNGAQHQATDPADQANLQKADVACIQVAKGPHESEGVRTSPRKAARSIGTGQIKRQSQFAIGRVDVKVFVELAPQVTCREQLLSQQSGQLL